MANEILRDIHIKEVLFNEVSEDGYIVRGFWQRCMPLSITTVLNFVHLPEF
jgi:hypothetical protein